MNVYLPLSDDVAEQFTKEAFVRYIVDPLKNSAPPSIALTFFMYTKQQSEVWERFQQSKRWTML